MNPHAARALESMRSPDPRARERGFDFLREHADAYVDDLVAAFEREGDRELRCRLLELVAEARSARALPVLAARLGDPDEELRMWAVRGLEMLDGRAAEQALEQAREDGWIV